MTGRILIVSDRAQNASTWPVLTGAGFEVTVVECADAGYALLLETRFDLVVIDLEHPIESTGITKRIRAHGNLSQISILTIAEWGTGAATMALAQGSDAFETAPIDGDRFMVAVERLLPKVVMTARAGGRNGDSRIEARKMRANQRRRGAIE
jgi:DNA-binding response OmpR family regulator